MKKSFSRLHILVGVLLLLSLVFVGISVTKTNSSDSILANILGGVSRFWGTMFWQQPVSTPFSSKIGNACYRIGYPNTEGRECRPDNDRCLSITEKLVCNKTTCVCELETATPAPVIERLEGHCVKDNKCVIDNRPNYVNPNHVCILKDGVVAPGSSRCSNFPYVPTTTTKKNSCNDDGKCIESKDPSHKCIESIATGNAIPSQSSHCVKASVGPGGIASGGDCNTSTNKKICTPGGVCQSGLVCNNACKCVNPPTTPTGSFCAIDTNKVGVCKPVYGGVKPGVSCGGSNLANPCGYIPTGGHCASDVQIKSGKFQKDTCYGSYTGATGASCNFNAQCEGVNEVDGSACFAGQCVAGKVDPKTGKPLTGIHCGNDMKGCETDKTLRARCDGDKCTTFGVTDTAANTNTNSLPYCASDASCGYKTSSCSDPLRPGGSRCVWSNTQTVRPACTNQGGC